MTERKIVLVTGGNTGAGYETVKALLQSDRPYHIFLGSRSVEKGTSAVETLRAECKDAKNFVEMVQLDVTDDSSIEHACNQVKAGHERLDVLINNAGATFDMEFLRGTVSLRECFNRAYDVNVTGAQIVTWTFMPLLLKATDPRLIFVAGLSHMTQVANGEYFPTPPQPAGWPKDIDFETIGYRCSKTALNMAMLDWNHKLKADGVKIWAVGPGHLATNLGNMKEKAKEMGCQHPSVGGEFLKRVVEGHRDADVGKLVIAKGLIPL